MTPSQKRPKRPLIQFETVGLRYDKGPEVLRDISFDIPKGSFHFLTGPSGAGKTSLMRLIYLGMRPTRGLLHMFDHEISTTPRDTLFQLRRKIGIVFQNFRLLPHLSAFDNVALPLRIMGLPEKDIKDNVEELLGWVGLGDYMKAKPMAMSGGQQQRIAIARAVIHRPELLLADEPTGNLDDEIGYKLLHLFEELNKLGTTIIIASHNETLMKRFDHKIIRLKNGLANIHGDLGTAKSFKNKEEDSAP